MPGPRPDDLRDRVLYQDDLIIVLNKPQGIPVHPGPRPAPSLEDGFGSLCFDYHHPPHLAHRLDRDTSGCLILGRNQKALKKLGRLFETGRIKKTYWAVVHGGPREAEGLIDGWVEKIKTPKGWYMRVCGQKEGAQTAVTAWRVVERGAETSWLECHPRTGRTHQIRVHCLSLGCPIVGDWVYGPPLEENPPLLRLHARAIEIPLYDGQPPVQVEAPPPTPFSTLDLGVNYSQN